MNLFETILYQPILKALIFLCHLTGGDLGFAIVLLTLFLRFLLLPLSFKSQKSQKEMADFQKEIQEIREKYKGNKEEQAKALVSFYQKKKINPFSGLIFVLIQLPILYAFYKVFTQGLQVINVKPSFLGIFDLSKPNIFFALSAGIFQYFQTPSPAQKSAKDPMTKFSNLIQKEMLYFFPIITFLFLLKFPSALALYWITNSLFSIVFEKIVFKKYV